MMMNKKLSIQKRDKGQVIPIVVIMLAVMIAMAALFLDGSSMMLDRRTAQAAADAGALAGAREMCKNSSSTVVRQTAELFADMNRATSSTATITADNQVKVITDVSNNSYFSKINLLGYNSLHSNAQAIAGCFGPATASNILPISWSCKAPVSGESDSEDCQIKTLDWKTEMKPLVTGSPSSVTIHDYGSVSTPLNFSKNFIPGYLYIVVDSNKISSDLEDPCADGTLQCDLNGDGISDVLAGGGRSWLDLDGGGGGAADLKKWILDGFDGTIAIHTWLPGQSGLDTSVYNAVITYMDEHPTYPIVLVPVFNGICDQNPEDKLSCETLLHDPIPSAENVVSVSGSSNYFHIAGFSAFYITCVDKNGNGAGNCPGEKQFIIENPGLKNSIKTIEGYFISDYPFDLGNPGTGGIDVGVSIVSLTN